MAKPTEQRVNKAFVTPDLDRPAIDPGSSDVADQSYERIEQLRAERALAGESSQASEQRIAEDEKMLNATSTSEDRSYDSIENIRAARAAGGDDYDRIEQLRVDRAGGDEPTQMVDTPPSGRDLLTGTEDPGVIETMRLDRWELEQAAQNYDAGVDLHADHAADIHAAHSTDAPATPDEGGLEIKDGFTPD